MGKDRLRALGVGLPTKNATTGGHADNHWTSEFTVRAVPHTRCFGNDLIISWQHIISELDLNAGPFAISRHANSCANNCAFIDRCIKAALFAIFGLQAMGAAENAAEIANIFAKDHDVLVLTHFNVHRIADGFNHCHTCHDASPPILASQIQCVGAPDAPAFLCKRLQTSSQRPGRDPY